MFMGENMSQNMNEIDQKVLELSKKFNMLNTVLLVGMICLGASAMLEIAPLLVAGSIIVCGSVFGQAILRREYKKLTKDQEEKK